MKYRNELENRCKELEHATVLVTNQTHPAHGRKAKVLYGWWVSKTGYDQHTDIEDYLGKGSKLHMQVCLDWEHYGQPEFLEVTEDDICLVTCRN